jgi:hypothetical protein
MSDLIPPDASNVHRDEKVDTPARKEARMTTNKVGLPPLPQVTRILMFRFR